MDTIWGDRAIDFFLEKGFAILGLEAQRGMGQILGADL